MRVASWRLDALGDAAGAEEALLRAIDAAPEFMDAVRVLETVQERPGRERDCFETLLRRARLESDMLDKREALQEAARLADQTLSDPELFERAARAMLAENDVDDWALEVLARILVASGRRDEAAVLLRRAAATSDGERAGASSSSRRLVDPRRPGRARARDSALRGCVRPRSAGHEGERAAPRALHGVRPRGGRAAAPRAACGVRRER